VNHGSDRRPGRAAALRAKAHFGKLDARIVAHLLKNRSNHNESDESSDKG